MARERIDVEVDGNDAGTVQAWLIRLSKLLRINGRCRLRVDPVGKRRSNRSNSYYFVAVVASLQQYALDQGDVMDKDTAHETLKRECGLWTESENPALNRPISWANYDQKSGSAYIDRCIGWLAQMGQPVPPPIVFGLKKWDEANPPNKVVRRSPAPAVEAAV